MQPCLVDGHVHLYDAFPPAALAEAAASAVRGHAARTGLPGDTPGVLMLTLTAGERPAGEVFGSAPPGWTAGAADDLGTLRLSAAGRPDLYLLPGRQVVTEEGLEVLALGTGTAPPEGKPVRETLATVRAAGALPVLPWGVGKWTGTRGALVRDLVEDRAGAPDLVLGDNAGRAGALGRPRILAEAEAAGRIVLPGTDPLPFPGEVRKVARMVFRAEFDPERPGESLIAWIRAQETSPEALGSAEGLLRFAGLQAGMQLRKRLRRK